MRISSNKVKDICSVENVKNPINAVLDVHLNEPIKLQIFNKNHKVEIISEDKPEIAIKSPITRERLEKQLNKF